MKKLAAVLQDALGGEFIVYRLTDGSNFYLSIYKKERIPFDYLICRIWFHPYIYHTDNEYNMSDPDFLDDLVNDLILMGEEAHNVLNVMNEPFVVAEFLIK